MKLYPIDQQIELYLEDCYDPETGEIREDLTEEQMFQRPKRSRQRR